MPDTDLPITGKDVSLVLLLNGVPRSVTDQVTRFEAKPVYDEIQIKNLGRSGSQIDMPFSHWEGTIELAISNSAIDDMIDLITLARRNRIPLEINATEIIRYRDLTSAGYQYRDMKLAFDRKTVRGESNTITIAWKSGVDRKKLF